MPQATHYDAIVIGTSQGGRLLPIAEALAGRKVALIERGPVGGTCVNVGCTPTKTMVVSARVAYLVRRGAEYGVHSGPIAVDLEAIRQRKQGIVHSGSLNPYTIFIDPQLGRVGMSENEARKQGRNIRVAKLPMNAVARALEIGETRGFMKAIVDAETQHILGCAMLCAEGGEIMTIIQVAMMGKLPYTALKEGIFTHPTLAEGLNDLFMTVDS